MIIEQRKELPLNWARSLVNLESSAKPLPIKFLTHYELKLYKFLIYIHINIIKILVQ